MSETMKKKSKVYIAAGYLAIIIFTVVAILLCGRNYTVYLNNQYGSDKTSVTCSDESVITSSSISRKDDYTRFVFKGIKEGKATVTATVYDETNERKYTTAYYEFSVLPTGVV